MRPFKEQLHSYNVSKIPHRQTHLSNSPADAGAASPPNVPSSLIFFHYTTQFTPSPYHICPYTDNVFLHLPFSTGNTSSFHTFHQHYILLLITPILHPCPCPAGRFHTPTVLLCLSCFSSNASSFLGFLPPSCPAPQSTLHQSSLP